MERKTYFEYYPKFVLGNWANFDLENYVLSTLSVTLAATKLYHVKAENWTKLSITILTRGRKISIHFDLSPHETEFSSERTGHFSSSILPGHFAMTFFDNEVVTGHAISFLSK